MASNISYNSYWGYYGINWSNASGNNNIIYSGQGDSHLFRSRIVLNTANMTISSSSKLVVKITVAQQGSQYYDYTVARLSTHNLEDPGEYFENDGYTPKPDIKNSTISQSKFYTDSNGNSPVGSAVQANGNTLYLVFDTKNKIIAGEKYYIYIGREGTSSSRFNAFQASEINLTYESYTACGAPTSVWANGIITPNGTFTVSWSGATAGNANAIVGYDIYYHITQAGSTPTTSTYTGMVQVGLTSTSGSKEIKVNNATRGYKIVCGVVTRGSAGAAYYSTMKTGGSVTINTLPKTDSMTVTATKEILPSTGGTVTFTLSGATDDHHSVSYVYATSETGTKKSISGKSVSLNISKETTVYFWAYDGLEYGLGNKSQTIQINTEPTCKIEATSAIQIATSSTVPNDCKYVLSPAFKVSKSNTTLGNSDSFTHYYRVYDSSRILIEEKKYSATGATHSISDIRNVITATPPFYYQFGATVNDGIEESQKIWGDQYYVTSAPAIVNIYNTDSGNNVTGMGQYSNASTTNPFYFSKKMCIDFVYDAGYENKTFTLNTSKSVQVVKVGSYLRAIFNDCGVTNPGTYQPQGYFLTKASYSTSASRSLYRIKPFEIVFSNITECHPYTNNNITISIASNNLNSSANPKEFGINADSIKSISNFSGALKYQGETSSVGILNISSSEDNMVFESFSYDNSAFQLYQNESHTVAFVLNFTNSFGDKYSGSKDFKINYKETPKINGINIILPNEGTDYVKEGQEIIFQVDYENCYNSDQILKIESQYGFETYSNVISKTEGTAEITAVVPKILSHKDLSDLTFSITNKASTSCFKDIKKNIVFLKHDTPNVVLTRTDYNDQDKELTVYFSPSDWGLDPILQTAPGANNEPNNNIEISLEAQNGKKTLSFKYNKDLKSCTFTNVILSENNIWESKLITLEITVASYAYHETTHTQQNTNTILVYNSTPTVAYRKNQLGINTKDPTGREEALVVIGGASGRNQIFYETNQDKPYCQVVNFQFNGGVWGKDLGDDGIGVIVGELPSAEQNSF